MKILAFIIQFELNILIKVEIKLTIALLHLGGGGYPPHPLARILPPLPETFQPLTFAPLFSK